VNKRTTLPAILLLIATVSLLTVFLQAQTLHGPLTNPDVIRMVRDKMPESTIIGKIQSGPVRFDLSPGGLALLRQANVSPNILRVMMAAEKAGTTPTPASPTKPTAGNVPGRTPAGLPAAAATVPGRAPIAKQRVMPSPDKMKIAAGPRIKIAGLAASTLTPSMLQTLQQQAAQARSDKAAGPSGARKIMAAGAPSGGTPAGGSTPGGNPTGGSTPGGNPPAGGGTGTPPGAAGQTSLSQKMLHAPQGMSQCKFSSNPTIETVSGKNRGIVFTPDIGTGPNPNNQYTIRGCNFGQVQGQVHLFGPFINHSSPVRLGTDTWSDNLIVVTFDPTFQDEYDLNNITLVVVASNGQNVQLPGLSFVAARASRPLARVPQSLVTMPKTTLERDNFVSPVTPATLRAANLSPFPQSVTVAFFQYSQLWDSPNTSDNYPQNRVSWSELIDISKLRPGFALDPDIQTFTVFSGDLSSHDLGVGGGSCKYYDTPLSAAVQNNKLNIGVQPAECDNYGKYIIAYYGLALSVIGPKGSKLNPWPDNL
jgi:hypothetical protein